MSQPQALPTLSPTPVRLPNPVWLEGCSPKARLFCTLLITLALVLSNNIEQAGGFCLLGLCLAGMGHIAPARLGRTLVSVNLFMLFVWLSLPFTVPGTPLFFGTLSGPLKISVEGVELAALLSLKANGAALFLLVLCGSLSLHCLGRTLQSCGLSRKFVVFFILLCRHITGLRQEFSLSMHALRLRTAHLRGMQRLRVHACLVCSLLVRSADHAEKVRMALECKPASLQYAEDKAQDQSIWPDIILCSLASGLLGLALV